MDQTETNFNDKETCANCRKELKAQMELIMENNDMLRSMRRMQRLSLIFTVIYILIIITPIILGIIFLPTLWDQFSNYLQSYYDVSGGVNLPQGLDLSIFDQLIER